MRLNLERRLSNFSTDLMGFQIKDLQTPAVYAFCSMLAWRPSSWPLAAAVSCFSGGGSQPRMFDSTERSVVPLLSRTQRLVSSLL